MLGDSGLGLHGHISKSVCCSPGVDKTPHNGLAPHSSPCQQQSVPKLCLAGTSSIFPFPLGNLMPPAGSTECYPCSFFFLFLTHTQTFHSSSSQLGRTNSLCLPFHFFLRGPAPGPHLCASAPGWGGSSRSLPSEIFSGCICFYFSPLFC